MFGIVLCITMNLKGKSWVGSIYHKFEAICQEVDNFVSKDTMNFVENRVQSIGVSVKKLYSDVEQNGIPPLEGDKKPEIQSVIGKQADIWDHDTPTSSNMTKFYSDNKLLPVEQGSIDTLNKCDTSRHSDIGLVTSCTITHGADSFNKTKTGVSLKEDGDVINWNDSDKGVEDKTSKVMIPVAVNPSSQNKVLCMPSDEENHNECNTPLDIACSPSLSVHEAEVLAVKQQGSIWYNFTDESDYFSDVPSNGWLSEGEIPLVLEFSLAEDKSLAQPREASADEGHQHDSPPMDSATLLACDAAQKPSETCESLHNSFSTKDEQIMASNGVLSSELVFSCCSRDDGKTQSSVVSSSQYTPSISLYASTAENICHTPVGSNGYNHHISVVHSCSPSATLSNEIKSVDMLPPFSIIKSNDYNVSATHGSVSVVSSESQHPQCFKGAQSTLLMSPSESGISGLDIGDLNMEAIDISTDEQCDVFNSTFYRATLYRQKNFRYYKKLFKDVLSSRKRLSKEYEHLAILHGDIDMESKHFFDPSSLPLSSTASLNIARSLPSHKISDSDWEEPSTPGPEAQLRSQAPSGFRSQDLHSAATFLLESDRIGNATQKYRNYRQYAMLNSNSIFNNLVTLYECMFSTQWHTFKRLMEAFPAPPGVLPQLHMTRIYVSAWFHDLYCSIREAVRLTSPVAFTELYSTERVPYSTEYDAFLMLLNASIRPTELSYIMESTLYIPRITGQIDWNSENPFDIAGYTINTNVLYGILQTFKERKVWHVQTLSTHATGRPSWLFDWQDGHQALAWFPRENNFNDDDVTIAYIVGVACTPKMAPRDVDDWQYGFLPIGNPLQFERVEPRRFTGSYEVRSIKFREAVPLPPPVLDVLENIASDATRRRKFRKDKDGTSSSRPALATGAEPGSTAGTPADTEVLIDQPTFPMYRITDWCYYSRVINNIEFHTRTGALRMICFK